MTHPPLPAPGVRPESGGPASDGETQAAAPHDQPAGTDGTVEIDVGALPGGAEAALEAVLMVADTPVSAERLAAIVELPVGDVVGMLQGLAAEYRGEGGARPRGFELREGAQGWRVYSAPAHADVVARLVLEGQTARLSQAALETLAVIAYRQPVTRGQVSAVRGVNVDGVVRTLLARGLVAEVGHDPLTGAVLFATTGDFLDRMGWHSLDELPPIAPHLPGIDALSALTESDG
ncbi:SMC-Scp complex subunit ScpB [Xylanimonas allomyrinae]|uniref:SMC-Scp complex subunit ScpB n=1 Tax=Xylanimonas allomyrinae TaxID=2509459 RepID=A0A4P6EQI3_9MICO|nr:SMC-Scp complex subunit ScpB [Xylanimonas allomyrinae]QAY62547.1 SMC-Scp complex subunit ScpB [Xylanimonas allomyrinae]